MNLGLLVLLLPQIYAEIKLEYTEFEWCWHNGWECRNDNGQTVYDNQNERIFEVTYNCENYTRVGRIWIWTERLPDTTQRFTVTNCDHIELHTDCTQSYRSSKIREFRVISVKHLEFLSTSIGYLHDNGHYHHLPPTLYLENIRFMRLRKELLQVAESGNCVYNSGVMKKIVMKRVTIEKLEATSASGEYDVLWSGVTVKEIDGNAICITGNITIEDSYFPNVKANSMSFQGENVVLRRNTFDTINEASINVTSFRFNFTDNKIKSITKKGFKIKSSQTSIERNHIVHLENTAFGDISPYYYFHRGTYTLSYSFTGNEIEFLSPFSLHCNWDDYGKTCTRFVINDNKFPCTCYNLVWLNAFQEGKFIENSGFYSILLNTTHHCGTSANCSLSQIIKFICHNESSIESQCGGFSEKEKIDVPTEQGTSYPNPGMGPGPSDFMDGTESYREIPYRYETTGGDEQLVPLEGDRGTKNYPLEGIKYSGDSDNRDSNRMILDKGYYTDHEVSSRGEAHYFPVWLIAVIAVGSIGLIASVFAVWYFRRRKIQKCIKIYKYERNKDSDSLIVGTRLEGGGNSSNNIFSD